MKLCWLIPDDRGGGVASVALSCCQQAAGAGHETTLLMVLSPTGWIGTNHDFQVSSLNLNGLAQETPQALINWLEKNPQDVLLINGCEQADAVIPYLPSSLKCVYVVHDTAPRYWQTAVREEENLEAIAVISETVARQFKHCLKKPDKVSVILNGCVFPELSAQINQIRQDELIFLGGDKPIKGALNTLTLWKQLVKLGFTGKLHWFGSIAPSFKNKIDRLPNLDKIQVYGRVQRDFIFSTAASAKVLLMLSHVEPFGMATIEAMSMGCVPVAWDIDTGTKEILTTAKTGLLAPLGNTRVLAEKVLEICNNYQDFETAAISHARTHFNAAVMWKGYQILIERISVFPPIQRSQSGQQPLAYKPPTRKFQLLPTPIRSTIRELVGRSPRLGYWLRDFRGF
ncbi:MAG: glycosyltransferase [Calothrix sp. MO_167.B42]|nr:glycosyltransferase [Calothrix sp. MO_167.B42]